MRRTRSPGGGPPPKECPQETIHDYLVQTRAFPKLRPFAIPVGTPAGRYRISQRVEHRWGVPRPDPVHTVLSAEFEVAQ